MKIWPLWILLSLVVLAGTSGCAGLLVGTAATGAAAIHDRRTAGTVLEDQSIEFKARSAINKDKELSRNTHLNIVSFNNIVLVCGEAPDPVSRQRVGQIVSGIEKVRSVHNEIRVAAPSSMMSRTSDTFITAKVKTKLIGIKRMKNFDPSRVKVVTENGVVYLMGLVTRAEAEAVTDAVRLIKGVQRVVKLFEYIG